jgi:hypothetical protein
MLPKQELFENLEIQISCCEEGLKLQNLSHTSSLTFVTQSTPPVFFGFNLHINWVSFPQNITFSAVHEPISVNVRRKRSQWRFRISSKSELTNCVEHPKEQC